MSSSSVESLFPSPLQFCVVLCWARAVGSGPNSDCKCFAAVESVREGHRSANRLVATTVGPSAALRITAVCRCGARSAAARAKTVPSIVSLGGSSIFHHSRACDGSKTVSRAPSGSASPASHVLRKLGALSGAGCGVVSGSSRAQDAMRRTRRRAKLSELEPQRRCTASTRLSVGSLARTVATSRLSKRLSSIPRVVRSRTATSKLWSWSSVALPRDAARTIARSCLSMSWSDRHPRSVDPVTSRFDSRRSSLVNCGSQ
mmetsp:Transcript_23594/g.62170  ORF Transcript_23594/g.62170 Transcript_23594/m.62170 type:complete len:259 (+) Transcript_23594:565-1341(+)